MRIVLLCDRPTSSVREVLRAVHAATSGRDAEVVCIAFSTRYARSPSWRRPRADHRHSAIWKIAEELNLPVEPLDPDANDPAELDRLFARHRPDTLLSLISFAVLTEATLDRFDDAVNLHDGALPMHAGVRATDYSIYEGDERSGFAFHRMTPELDGGPLLVTGSVSIGPDEPARSVVERKLALAAESLPDVLDALEAGDPGVAQTGPSSHHTMVEVRRLLEIGDPSTVTADDLARRLRAFSTVWLPAGRSRQPCSRIDDARWFHLHRFTTSDGKRLAITRIRGWPPALHHLRRAVRFAQRKTLGRR